MRPLGVLIGPNAASVPRPNDQERLAVMPRHVLIIVRTNVTHDARVLKEAMSLWEAGHRVTVLGIRTSSRDTSLELKEYCTIRRVTTTVFSEDRNDGQETERAKPPEPTKSHYAGPLGELRHWAGRMRENRLYLAAALPLKPDVVISCDLTALPAGYWLKRRLGCGLVYDAHELYPEMWPAGHPVFRMLYSRTEGHHIRRADAVFTVNHLLADELVSRYRIPQPGVVMNGPSIRVDEPSSVHTPVKVLYQGGYIEGRYLTDLVRKAERLRGVARLTMQGRGSLDEALRRAASEAGTLDVVDFAGPYAPQDAVDEASAHDVGIALYEPSNLNNRLASPNKLFDYMAAGLAVVAGGSPIIGTVLDETGAGTLVDDSDPDAALDMVLELAGDLSRLSAFKRAALDGVDRFLWENQVAPLVSAVEALAAQ